MSLEDMLDRTCAAAESMWEKAQEKDKLIESLRQRAEQAEADAAVVRACLHSVIHSRHDDNVPTRDANILLDKKDSGSRFLAKHKAMEETLKVIASIHWQAQTIAGTTPEGLAKQALQEKPE